MNTDLLIVFGVWLLITFIVTTSQYFVFTKYFSDLTVNAILVYVIFNTLCLLLCINYYLAIRTDAGGVPSGWEPPQDANVREVKKSNAKPRYCRTCQQYKPPRSHHCSSCQRCILKMDHHCPWIDLACGMCLTVLGLRLYEIISEEMMIWYSPRAPDNMELIFLMLDIIANIIVLVPVGMLSIFHIWSICENITTIESWEMKKIEKMMRDGQIKKAEFPYHIGIYHNICQVLGPNPLLWLWPQRMLGDGLTYPVAKHLSLPVIWPPTEYEASKRKYTPLVRKDSEGYLVKDGIYDQQISNLAWQDPHRYGTYGQDDDSSEKSTLSDYGYRSSDLDDDDDEHVPLATMMQRHQLAAMQKKMD